MHNTKSLNIIYRQAQEEDLSAVTQLIIEEYSRSGYVSDDSGEKTLGLNKYLRLPSTTTFMAIAGVSLLGTVSIVFDSDDKLPMDNLYCEELNVMRSNNERLAEVTQLAISSGLVKKMLGLAFYHRLTLLTNLFKQIYLLANDRGVTQLCIAVNPKHDKMYESIGFRTFGPVRDYGSVNNAPAVPKRLELAQIDKSSVATATLKNILGIPQ